MDSRHNLGPLDLSRCARVDNIYEKSARQAKEGIIRKSLAQVVEKLKIHEANVRLPV